MKRPRLILMLQWQWRDHGFISVLQAVDRATVWVWMTEGSVWVSLIGGSVELVANVVYVGWVVDGVCARWGWHMVEGVLLIDGSPTGSDMMPKWRLLHLLLLSSSFSSSLDIHRSALVSQALLLTFSSSAVAGNPSSPWPPSRHVTLFQLWLFRLLWGGLLRYSPYAA